MRKMKKSLFVLGMFLIALATGCQRIPMYERGSGVYLRISIDQSLDPLMEAYLEAVGNPSMREKVVGKMPEIVRVCFYDVVSHELVKEDFLPPGGDFVDVPAGVYDVVVYSLGTEVTQVSGTEERASGYAFTSSTGIRVKPQSAQAKDDEDGERVGTDDQPVIFEPDHMFVGRLAGAVVPVQPDDAETVVLSVELSRISESWTLEIANVEGAERIQKAEVYVTGQAAGRFLWDERTTNHPCAIALDCEIDVQNGKISSVYNTFGKYPQEDSDVLVLVLVTTNSGARCLYVYDATNQWLNPDNSERQITFTEMMEIPDDDYQGNGLDPFVIDWDGEDITVIIGC
ncbi:MAG: DUF5119 domain-containing protein [Bacteroidales bacterium]|nr:DUF5119 domain-containing protein [Bacteroidales bacterium]